MHAVVEPRVVVGSGGVAGAPDGARHLRRAAAHGDSFLGDVSLGGLLGDLKWGQRPEQHLKKEVQIGCAIKYGPPPNKNNQKRITTS